MGSMLAGSCARRVEDELKTLWLVAYPFVTYRFVACRIVTYRFVACRIVTSGSLGFQSSPFGS